ncbi:MAG TPA: S8/S53 family peptidase [Bacteroidales bacterium]|nr:S8/S53 family peptidase [Bacteroidales bacterium]HON20591.1 S8/S53 family peptidase [Bacteroidales bacterium]HOR81575.1 S8/S53 family peptidase [Bacteroidales bacterium]HPJ90347.1 S8/S53 family peptidase [Bacteroidales bacterium]
MFYTKDGTAYCRNCCQRSAVLLFIILCCYGLGFSQAPTTYVITFSDKKNSSYDTAFPEAFLSLRAIEKRQRLNIPITERDLPINDTYINLLKNFSSIEIITQSKWLNYIVVTCDNQLVLETIKYLPFVSQVKKTHEIDYSHFDIRFSNREYNYPKNISTQHDTNGLAYYGLAAKQIAVHSGQYLHQQGYQGEGMLIVMLDNGYNSLDTLTLFNSFRENRRLVGIYDAAQGEPTALYRAGDHGTKVLSVMALNEPYHFVGTAPYADYFLIRTEMDTYEDILEEYFWVAGAEMADSIGADVVNSSLGYTYFNNEEQNHSFDDLDGRHSVASIAASILSQNGCIVCVAAGNEGEKEWHYISIPSDAPDALCVAAMSTDSTIAGFSSRGSKSFTYTKPDVTSVGFQAAYCTMGDTIDRGNGTSLATPVCAGLCACLWQAFPDKSSLEIMEAIRQSAHIYEHKDTLFGNGIPNFQKAYKMLLESGIETIDHRSLFKIYPNPTNDILNISCLSDNAQFYQLQIYDIRGSIVKTHSFHTSQAWIDVTDFSQGIYFVKCITDDNQVDILKFVKY